MPSFAMRAAASAIYAMLAILDVYWFSTRRRGRRAARCARCHATAMPDTPCRRCRFYFAIDAADCHATSFRCRLSLPLRQAIFTPLRFVFHYFSPLSLFAFSSDLPPAPPLLFEAPLFSSFAIIDAIFAAIAMMRFSRCACAIIYAAT
jgi:hypothetical protein